MKRWLVCSGGRGFDLHRGMLKLISHTLLLAFSWQALAPAARACDTAATATPESTCVVMEREGARGVWFALETADELRKHKLEVSELRLQIRSYEQMALAREVQVHTYLDVITLKDSAIKTAETNMGAFARQAREAREAERAARDELHAWYRSPALWAAVGGILVTGIVAALEVRE